MPRASAVPSTSRRRPEATASPVSPSSSTPVWRRVAAAAIDGALGVGLAVALSSTVGMYFARRAVVTLRIGEPDTFWQGPIPLMLGVVGEVNFLLPFTLFLAFLPDMLSRGSAGKQLLGLGVTDLAGRPATTGTRVSRTLIKTVGFWGIALALVVGVWPIGAVALGLGGVVAIGSLVALVPGGRTLHDRFSGTVVSRIRP